MSRKILSPYGHLMHRLYSLFIFMLLLQGCSSSSTYRNAPPVKVIQPKDIPYVPPPKPQPRLSSALIMIDPGHGGDDAGTISLSKPIYQEKSLTLSTAKLLKEYLRQLGYRTMMTRNDDTFIPLLTRATLANENNTTLFVSVHYNSAPSAEAHGIEVFYYQSDDDKPRTQCSKQLASMILDEVIQNTQAKSRGIKKANFAVIRETKMPAVLIEGGFLTNQDELNKIKDPAYVKRIAWGIAKGVDHYVRTKLL